MNVVLRNKFYTSLKPPGFAVVSEPFCLLHLVLLQSWENLTRGLNLSCLHDAVSVMRLLGVFQESKFCSAQLKRIVI